MPTSAAQATSRSLTTSPSAGSSRTAVGEYSSGTSVSRSGRSGDRRRLAVPSPVGPGDHPPRGGGSTPGRSVGAVGMLDSRPPITPARSWDAGGAKTRDSNDTVSLLILTETASRLAEPFGQRLSLFPVFPLRHSGGGLRWSDHSDAY